MKQQEKKLSFSAPEALVCLVAVDQLAGCLEAA